MAEYFVIWKHIKMNTVKWLKNILKSYLIWVKCSDSHYYWFAFNYKITKCKIMLAFIASLIPHGWYILTAGK
jgi:hypothetical protein